VSCECPGVHPFATALFHRSQLDERTLRVEPRLLAELAQRDRQEVFVRSGLPLRDRPGARVLVAEERAARVDEEHFERARRASIHQKARAALHARSISRELSVRTTPLEARFVSTTPSTLATSARA